MKALTDIGLVALGLVVGIVIGQCLQYNKHRKENIEKVGGKRGFGAGL